MNNNFLIIGDDAFIRETEVRKIKERFLPRADSELDFSTHGPGEIEEIMDSLGTLPFSAGKRVVLVKEFHHFPEGYYQPVLSYIKTPLPTNVLILESDGSFRDSAQYKEISKVMEEIKTDVPKPLKLREWIYSFLKKANIPISNEAVELILELKGTDTIGVKTELEKLAVFSGGEKIERGHVEALIGKSANEEIYDLVNALDSGQAKSAVHILEDLYGQKRKPHEIIGYLSWHIRTIQQIKALTMEGKGPNDISRELRYHPWRAKKLVDQASRYSLRRVDKWIALLFKADTDIKQGKVDPELAMEMLLVDLLKDKEGCPVNRFAS